VHKLIYPVRVINLTSGDPGYYCGN